MLSSLFVQTPIVTVVVMVFLVISLAVDFRPVVVVVLIHSGSGSYAS